MGKYLPAPGWLHYMWARSSIFFWKNRFSNQPSPSKHWTRQGSFKKNQRSPKPIFAQFVNWRIAEEIRNRIIELNTKRRTNVFVSQVYSKQLTLRRNGALKYRRDYLNKNSDVQIKLEFPAILRYRRKCSRVKWDTLKVF